MNDKNLSMIKDVLLTQTKNERKYDKEILGKSTSFSHFEMKIIGFLSSIPIVNPHDNLKICWDIIHFFLTIFLLFWIPIDVCFQVNMPSLFSICVSTFFMSDIFLNLNTAYFQKGISIFFILY